MFHSKYISEVVLMRRGRDVVAFKIIRGFLQIGAEKWAIVAKMPQLTSQPLDVDLMVRNDGWQTHHHHQLSLL